MRQKTLPLGVSSYFGLPQNGLFGVEHPIKISLWPSPAVSPSSLDYFNESPNLLDGAAMGYLMGCLWCFQWDVYGDLMGFYRDFMGSTESFSSPASLKPDISFFLR